VELDANLVRRLVAAQFPRWSALPVEPVRPGGHDHRTFRLGDELSVRLPSADRYALQVAKEQRWLPELAPRLPLAVPEPVARGAPGEGYPYEWSVYRWLEGEPASTATIRDPVAFAGELAGFLRALAAAPTDGGPAPGPHNFHRGGPVRFYEDEALAALDALGDRVDRDGALRVWERAVASAFEGPPVWFHGDVAAGNLLLREGRLAAVIDFGTSGVGDPACDVVIAWTLLRGEARQGFREALGADGGVWARGAGWALWKALITEDLVTIREVLDDPNVNGAG
jgi:aminoglycoside phosphotransferase (APT) family kinase protein